ncbi:MAG: hypothetical protein WED34_21510 [Planctomycetales bacterium]
MSIKPDYFRYLEHLGQTVAVGELHADPHRRNAIALRHDVDHDLDLALEVAHHEHARGLRATYYILHTAPYWDDPDLSCKLRQLEAYGHEVGLHCNVVAEWIQRRTDDVDARLGEILARLRSDGVAIRGTSAHGDRVCYRAGFINYWIWKELRPDDPAGRESGRCAEGIFVDDERWRIAYPADDLLRDQDGRTLPLWSVSLAAHGLEYDASHVAHDSYWTDSGGSWQRSGDPLHADLSRGRHQVLMHPFWWRGPRKTILVLSTARSGSQWLSRFVDKATSCRGLHEWTLNHDCSDKEPQPDKLTDHEYGRLVEDEQLAAARIDGALEHLARQKRDVLEANVYLEPFLEELRERHPDVALVHLHRDGRDVVRSLINRGWYDTPDDPRHPVVPVEGWDELSQLERACCYYRHTTERLMRFCPKRIEFERMVREVDYISQFLRQFDIVVHPLLAESIFDQPSNVSRSYAFPNYARWRQRQRRIFDEMCGPVQEPLGYGSVAEVAPQRRPSIVRRMPRWTGFWSQLAELMRIELPGFSGRQMRGTRLVVSARHLWCIPEWDGLRLIPTPDASPSAHAILARGSWNRLSHGRGIPCSARRWFQVEIDASVSRDLVARVFALFYDREGRLSGQRVLGRMRVGTGIRRFAVAPDAGASHWALALHLGGQPPSDSILVRSALVKKLRFPTGYRVPLPLHSGDSSAGREGRKAA